MYRGIKCTKLNAIEMATTARITRFSLNQLVPLCFVIVNVEFANVATKNCKDAGNDCRCKNYIPSDRFYNKVYKYVKLLITGDERTVCI